MARVVVLLSGGLDSATVLAMAKAAGHTCACLTVSYGQRHGAELRAAKRIATALGADRHTFASASLDAFGGSALTDEIPVPKDELGEGIPVTYVPARNTVLLSLALAFAEVTDADEIHVGVNALDYSGYPDCRPEYIAAFDHLAQVATKAGVEGRGPRVVAPLLTMTKAQIIQAGLSLGLDYGMTHTCYDPDELDQACGHCDACLIRGRAFTELGLTDPALAHHA